MALSWIVGKGLDVRRNFAKLSSQDTFLVNGFYQPFIEAIEDFFNNTPIVKDFQYIVNWNIDGGIRSIEQQASKGNTQTKARGGCSAHNYGLAVDFVPINLVNKGMVTGAGYKTISLATPYTAHPPGSKLFTPLAEPWAVAVQALYNHPLLYSGALFTRLNDFNHIEWREYRRVAATISPYYFGPKGICKQRSGGSPTATSKPAPTKLSAPVTTPRGPGISPFIAGNESFHPHIQYELTRRRVATEMANTYMPFMKLTSLVKVYNKNLQTPSGKADEFGAYCPTLGIHGRVFTDFDSIYYPADGRSIVGYATKVVEGTPNFVAVVVETGENDPPNIPPPGIMSMNAERTTAGGFGVRGGLFKANLNIRAYSLGQVNTLLKYFIRQGTKVVLEIGRQSSSTAENLLSNSTELQEFRNTGLGKDASGKDVSGTTVKELFQKFNWKRKQPDIEGELKPFVVLETGQRELIEKYTYNNFGNYELFIGYVASFKMKYTKENIYDIELTIHSVQQFEVPTKLGGTRSSPSSQITVSNPCEPVDIMDYFKPESAYRENSFLKVLANCSTDTGNLYSTWGSHVIPLRAAGAQAGSGGMKSNGYLISWECFVDLILNDPVYGLLGTFQLSADIDAKTLNILRSGLLSRIGSSKVGNSNDINSNEVSWHKSLRSTDANTMIIYNEKAQAESTTDYAKEAVTILRGGGELSEEDIVKLETAMADPTVKEAIKTNTVVGSFERGEKNTSYLTSGIWINSNAITEAFSAADTISVGITNLLTMMNNATQGYWNLHLLSAEPEVIGLRVIDSGLSKPVNAPLLPMVGDFSAVLPTNNTQSLIDRLKSDLAEFTQNKYLYVFNRKLTRNATDDLGGELLDINIDMSMPNVIAVQVIAGVGGVAQRGLLSSIDVDELKAISMFDTYPASNQPNPTCADAVSNLTVDKNKSGTVNEYQMGRIIAAVQFPQYFEKEGGLDKVIATIEEDAFNNWKKSNEEAIKAGTVTEEAGKELVKSDIQGIRQVPTELYERNNPGVLGIIREFAASYGQALDLVENNVSKFVALLDANKQKEEIHPFNVSNLTKTTVDLTIPGIGGILLFQAFVVDRAPNLLKRGYYIVTKVAHEFSVENGWITKIQGRFRFKPNMQGDV
jgi:hypothetical protein